ncbi:glycoside hydrolase, partial [Gymnopus androsaceus JB14]
SFPVPPIPNKPSRNPKLFFPPVGSVSRDYSPSSLAQLWDLVESVESPPFTITATQPHPSSILSDLKLPSRFFFAVATAPCQVEGAVKDEGKGPNHWDWAAHIDDTLADVVDLHYYLYKEDIARIAALGVNAHSFSISWSRIYPFGAADSPVSQAGLERYADVIASHLQANITPVFTLLHWDPPLAQAAYYGGFTFNDFVNYVLQLLRILIITLLNR